jgi:hypothetical protein
MLKLDGDWTFDALSADARTLYLIQRLGDVETLRYNVRAVDVATLIVVPGVIAAKGPGSATEQMAGVPVNRLVDADARWVYTLYTTTSGGAFVHALDTATKRAICLDLPWKHAGERIAQIRMGMAGPTLVLRVAGRATPVAWLDAQRFSVRAAPRLPDAL